MKTLICIFVILVAISATLADIECFYCGLRKECTDPFDESTSETFTCSIGCMKFEGLDSENLQIVLVRGCGGENKTFCEENKEWYGSKGKLCHCTTDLCNSKETKNDNSSQKMSSNLLLGLISAILVTFMLWHIECRKTYFAMLSAYLPPFQL